MILFSCGKKVIPYRSPETFICPDLLYSDIERDTVQVEQILVINSMIKLNFNLDLNLIQVNIHVLK